MTLSENGVIESKLTAERSEKTTESIPPKTEEVPEPVSNNENEESIKCYNILLDKKVNKHEIKFKRYTWLEQCRQTLYW